MLNFKKPAGVVNTGFAAPTGRRPYESPPIIRQPPPTKYPIAIDPPFPGAGVDTVNSPGMSVPTPARPPYESPPYVPPMVPGIDRPISPGRQLPITPPGQTITQSPPVQAAGGYSVGTHTAGSPFAASQWHSAAPIRPQLYPVDTTPANSGQIGADRAPGLPGPPYESPPYVPPAATPGPGNDQRPGLPRPPYESPPYVPPVVPQPGVDQPIKPGRPVVPIPIPPVSTDGMPNTAGQTGPVRTGIVNSVFRK